MTFDDLMALLAERHIRLVPRDGNLSVSAGKDVLTPEITLALKQHKQEILAFLQCGGSPAARGDVAAGQDDDARFQPFPFSDLQVGFYMASDSFLEFHVRPHYYCETDKDFLDVERYERALNLALQRHQGAMVIVVDNANLRALPELPHVRVTLNDFSDLSPEQADAQLRQLRERWMRQELPLDAWPWFHIEVSVWNGESGPRYRIHANYNNFYSDGFGATLFQRDIDRFYANPALVLPALTLTYRNAVLKLAALSEGAAGQRAKKYWFDRLADLPGAPELPLRPLVSRRVRSKLVRREGRLPADTWNRLKQFGRSNGLTPTSVIVAGYAEILSLWSGSQHFILSNMVTRRLPVHEEIMQVVGNFASLYPLEIDLRNTASFAERARRVQQQILRDADHREWGGMQVMQAFNRLRGEFGSTPCPFVVGSGLFMEKYKKADFSCLETSQTMLDHQFWELDDGSYYYVWDLLEEFFPVGMIDDMWQAFGTLLEHLSTNADHWQGAAPAPFPRSAIADPCIDWTAGRHAPLLHDNLAAFAARWPERRVLAGPTGSLTYEALDRASATLAQRLTAKGVAANQLVAVVMDRGARQMTAVFGILRAGAAYVPIDPHLPQARIDYLIENSGATIALTESKYLAALDWPKTLDVIDVSQVPDVATPCAAAAILPDQLAYVIYTSGSTGNPKGVMISHRGATNTIADINRRYDVDENDTVFGVSSFSFDLSVYDLFGVVAAGARLVYPAPEMALNPAHWLDLLLSESVTVWNSAPPLMGLLIDIAQGRGVILPSLRLVMLSGDWIPVELPALIRKIAPNAAIVSLGGATEASIWSIYYDIDQVDPEWVSIPYGRAMDGQGWLIRDSQHRPTPTWVTGELFITGLGLALGYLGDPEKTARAFTVDALTGQRMYRTGDRGRYLPDGNIEFMGRLDAQVKIQGHRIELGEIEAALVAHPLVKEALVLAAPVAAGGTAPAPSSAINRPNRAMQLNAYIVLHPEDEPEEPGEVRQRRIHELREALGAKLPAYMVPAAWTFPRAIPLTPNGKVDRQALLGMANAELHDASAQAPAVAPRSALERAIADVWQSVLSCAAISIHDDFFALGGQSFDAVRSIALLQERLGKSVSLADVWRCRTIVKLAAIIEAPLAHRTGRHLVEINAKPAGRPVFIVHPAGGHASGYYALGQLLKRPSYGLVALTDNADLDGLATIALMAARYVRELKRVQPQGPYSLCGWSSGGCIAFDMAAQLENMGDQVDVVVMIDCPSPMVHDKVGDVDMLINFFADMNQGRPVAGLERDALARLAPAARFDLALARLNREAKQPFDRDQLHLVFRVFTRIVDAVRSYRPRAIRADIAVVRAADGVVEEFEGHPEGAHPDWGWSRFTSGAVRARTTAGTHHSLLLPPYVDATADWINALWESGEFAHALKTESVLGNQDGGRRQDFAFCNWVASGTE